MVRLAHLLVRTLTNTCTYTHDHMLATSGLTFVRRVNLWMELLRVSVGSCVGMFVCLLRLEGGGKLQASLTISSNSCWRVRGLTNLNGCLDCKRYGLGGEGTFFSVGIWAHHFIRPSHGGTALATSPRFTSQAPALKARRSNPRNLFPCDRLLCCPQREWEEKEKKGENMSQERQFNMTKPVPGDPLFSSPDPYEPLLFPPLSWSLVPPFLFPPPPSGPLESTPAL